MLQGFIDDSGSNSKSQFYYLAGFILDTQRWEEFSDDWDAALKSNPGIDYFKMFRANKRTVEFEGWQESDVQSKVNQLVSVIEKHNPVAIYTVIDRVTFNKMIVPNVRGPYLSDPYQYLFPLIFDVVAKYQKEVGIFPTPVDVDFDEQGEAGMHAQSLYPVLKKTLPSDMRQMLGRLPLMLDDKKVLPLQAADMLAWSLRRKKRYPGVDERWDWLHQRLLQLLPWGMGYSEASYDLLLKIKRENYGEGN